MKITAAIWALIFVITLLTGGFIPAFVVTALAVGASMSGALVGQRSFAQLDPETQRKMLERGK